MAFFGAGDVKSRFGRPPKDQHPLTLASEFAGADLILASGVDVLADDSFVEVKAWLEGGTGGRNERIVF